MPLHVQAQRTGARLAHLSPLQSAPPAAFQLVRCVGASCQQLGMAALCGRGREVCQVAPPPTC